MLFKLRYANDTQDLNKVKNIHLNMQLTEEEKQIIESISDEQPALTLEEIHQKTGISYSRLKDKLSLLLRKGIISETLAHEIIHVENKKKLAIIHIYDKK